MNMEIFLLLIMVALASEQKENNGENLILVKIEEDEYTKVHKKTSKYIGVFYNEEKKKWSVSRWSKNEKKTVHNGSYKDEETAARASDTLARKLMANSEQNHELNFPDDNIEVYPEEKSTSSKYIGVSYTEKYSKWRALRWGKKGNKRTFTNGYYKDEETAAHASDTLARKLMENGEKNLKLNFPDDNTEVFPNKKSNSSNYIGVSYNEKYSRWTASRRSKTEKQTVFNGSYKNEEIAAHASDTLARKLVKNGEENHKLNFPDDDTEVYAEYQKRKRKGSENEDLGFSQYK